MLIKMGTSKQTSTVKPFFRETHEPADMLHAVRFKKVLEEIP